MKTLKKLTAFLLAVAVLASFFSATAAEPKKKTYHDYGTYVLLGDSVSSGYNDLEYVNSEFRRVDVSYAAYAADDLGAELIPLACPGFRTIEMRYILEDDYVPDDYLFHASHTPDEEIEALIPYFRQSIADAGLITLGIGGNDWGAYLGWVASDIMEEEGCFGEFVKKARVLLEEKGIENDILDSLIDLADTMDALPGLLDALPKALRFGLNTYFENWNPMIEDIYALNPDVTLLVIGMFDTGVKSVEDAQKNEKALIKLNIAQAIVDFANKPMIEGAKKYGYTFVDTTGTVCDDVHPNAEGHRYIADKILEALPNADLPYTDVEFSSRYYSAVDYMYRYGYMSGTGDTVFEADKSVTRLQLAEALYNMAGSPEGYSPEEWVTENKILKTDKKNGFMPDGTVSALDLSLILIRNELSQKTGLGHFVRTLILSFRTGSRYNFAKAVTRGDVAECLTDYCNL